jgi:hypothetical protein
MAKRKQEREPGEVNASQREIAAQFGREICALRALEDGSALAVGRKLIEAKARLSHGNWLPFLRHEAKMSERTAQRYMRTAKFAKSANLADLPIPLTALSDLAASTTPAQIIDRVVAHARAGQPIGFNVVAEARRAAQPTPFYPPRSPRMVEPVYPPRVAEEAPIWGAEGLADERLCREAFEFQQILHAGAARIRRQNIGTVLAKLTGDEQAQALQDAEDTVAGLRLHIGRARREPAKAKPDEAKPGENVIQFPTSLLTKSPSIDSV